MLLGFYPFIPYLYRFASVRRVFQHSYSGKLVVDGIRHELDIALIRVFHNPNALYMHVILISGFKKKKFMTFFSSKVSGTQYDYY
jgi:hypothetical protein